MRAGAMYADYYRGKVALVTGAAGGMGKATAIAFAVAGAKVVVADIIDGSGTVEEIVAAGGEARYQKVDVSSATSVKGMIDATLKAYGRLDCAFNNAAIIEESVPLAEIDEETWDRTMDVNLKGVFLCMKYEIPVMQKQGGGAIVNTSSVNAFRILKNTAAYTASKFGVIGITRMAAVEYGADKIRVNAICPGAIRTPMMEKAVADDPSRLERVKHTRPLGVVGEPDVIANACLWLCSDQAAHVTAHSLNVDGGYIGAA